MTVERTDWELPRNGGGESPQGEHLERAAEREAEGLLTEAVYHLLLSYSEAQREFQGSFLFEGHPALEGLHHAWELACKTGDKSLAEHVLACLEPYLEMEDVEGHAATLESMSGQALSGMADALSDAEEIARAITGDIMQAVGKSAAVLAPAQQREPAEANAAEPLGPGSCTFDALVGYESALRELDRLGLGPDEDPEMREFVRLMGEQHGIVPPPFHSTAVFIADAREDADRLMLAAAAHLDQPTIRMRVDENPFGGTVLCLIASNGFTSRDGMMAGDFNGAGVLVLEGIDEWGTSYGNLFELPSDEGEAMVSGISRGALKAIMLIRSAMANPLVTVLASISARNRRGVEALEAYGPVEYVEIAGPDEGERDAIWDAQMDAHTSLSALDRYELVRLSANMPRCDIESAAQEAVEQAFAESLRTHRYVPVTRDNILDKIAAYQPVDSDEYHEIEESFVEDLISQIEKYEADGAGRGE